MDRVLAPCVGLGNAPLSRVLLGESPEPVGIFRSCRMCGIVGLLVKTPALRPQLGALMVPMLVGMTERGPDSAGLAVYTTPVSDRHHKLSLYSGEHRVDWPELLQRMAADFAHAHENRRTRESRGVDHRRRSGRAHGVACPQCAHDCSTLRGTVHRPLQGRGRTGRHRRAISFQVAARLAPGGTHAHGHRIGRDSGACPSLQPPAATFAWCTTDLCPIRIWCARNWSRWA